MFYVPHNPTQPWNFPKQIMQIFVPAPCTSSGRRGGGGGGFGMVTVKIESHSCVRLITCERLT